MGAGRHGQPCRLLRELNARSRITSIRCTKRPAPEGDRHQLVIVRLQGSLGGNRQVMPRGSGIALIKH
jgi:hypothetical protein